MLVDDIMVKDPVSLDKNVTVRECVGVLYKMRIGGVVVVEADKRVVGIFTERDLLRVIAQGMSLDTRLEDVMSTNVVTVTSGSLFGEAKEMMRLYRVRRIPVVDGEGRLVVLISIRHIVDYLFVIIPRSWSA